MVVVVLQQLSWHALRAQAQEYIWNSVPFKISQRHVSFTFSFRVAWPHLVKCTTEGVVPSTFWKLLSDFEDCKWLGSSGAPDNRWRRQGCHRKMGNQKLLNYYAMNWFVGSPVKLWKRGESIWFRPIWLYEYVCVSDACGKCWLES
jgi:hypothetical protein